METLLRDTIEASERAEAHVAGLPDAAEELRFPFETPRPHREDLVGAIEDALSSGRPAAVTAPTGTGKTAPRLRPAQRRNDVLAFLCLGAGGDVGVAGP